MIDRRRFNLHLAGAAGLGTLGLAPWSAQAEDGFAAGRDYLRLSPPVPVPAAGKIEVMEFFWYGCPHCWALEPSIEPWAARLPADVHYQLVPYNFGEGGETPRAVHERIFCVWEVLGLLGTMHRKTFERFHVQRRPINSLDEMLKFAAENGVEASRVRDAWSSFGVETRIRQVRRTCDQYGIHSTPVIAVQGRFETEPGMVGAAHPGLDEKALGQRTLAVADYLVNLVRKGA